jgi:NAD(P)-dependent dehydrogenase (short-subunit alcohol dehydrogenase family)
VGYLTGGESFRRFPLRPARASRHAREALGPDRQYVFDLRLAGRGKPDRLCDDQDGADRDDTRDRHRDGAGGHHLQCGLPRNGAVSPAILDRIAGMAEAQGISKEQAERDYIASRHPTERFVAMEHVGALVAFLCGPAGQDITGTTLPIDGGWLTR